MNSTQLLLYHMIQIQAKFAFEINNWEKLLLTDNSDYGIITENVGVDITDIYDANYFTTSQSVLTIDPGFSGNGIDRFDIDANSQIELSYASIKDIKTLDNASWINISESSSHDSGVLIYERLSDNGISIVSFTDRDGASPNIGEAVQWSFNNGNFNDLDKYIVINKNDYSSAITYEEGGRYIGNVFRDNWTWDVIVNEFGTSSMDGVNATFNIDGTVDVTSENSTNNINTDINLTGGEGQVIDRLTTTNLADTVTNNSSLGMVVDLGGSINAEADDLLVHTILMRLMF